MSYKIFCSHHPNPSSRDAYNRLFEFWHTQWIKTFKEVKGLEQLFSDEFHRQNEVTGIFMGEEPVAVFIFNFYDLDVISHRRHSYFKAYPPEVMDQILSDGARKIMSMGNLAIAPDWRKHEGLAEILLSLACRRFLESDADFLLAYTRNARKVNELCYRHGAHCLLAAQKSDHGDEVDLVGIRRDDAIIAPSRFTLNKIEELWRERDVHGGQAHLPAKIRVAV